MVKTSLGTSFLAALVPVTLCLIYIFALRQGKPPGYDRDRFEQWTTGTGFAPETNNNRQFRHPLSQEQP